ncbi:MAG: hypothetical protein LBR25_09470 [Erysipelotrichaceae bacterium]|jgi:protein-S-isoprenylcysteine O-methyltransferase Ste14|nr:hypothetical protein [Erysipelotrichaceae bacterium]
MRGWIYFALYFGLSVICTLALVKINPEVVIARNKTNWQETKPYDKVLVPLYAVLEFIGIYIAAGLCVRFNLLTSTPVFYSGLVLIVILGLLAVLPFRDNRHFEATMRIQSDRQHRVCDQGTYAIVRHPGYSITILGAFSIAMVFGVLAFVAAIAIAVVLIIRTAYEDKTLQAELSGYKEYTKKVRYRLLPFVW